MDLTAWVIGTHPATGPFDVCVQNLDTGKTLVFEAPVDLAAIMREIEMEVI